MAMGKPVIATALPGIQKEFGFDSGINYIENAGDALEKAMWFKNANKIEDEGSVLSFNPVIEPRVAQWT